MCYYKKNARVEADFFYIFFFINSVYILGETKMFVLGSGQSVAWFLPRCFFRPSDWTGVYQYIKWLED